MVLALAAAILFGAAAAAQPSAQPQESAQLRCRPGPAEPSTTPELRPTPTAHCAYDQHALYENLAALLQSKGRGYNVNSAALSFGLPEMASQYDSDRSASYAMAVSGEGGWTMWLWVRESAYPLDGEPAAFAPGVHPRRLFAIDALDIRYDIQVDWGDVGPDAAGQGCMTLAQARAILAEAGWIDRTFEAQSGMTDGGVANPMFQATGKGGPRISIATGMPGRGLTEAQMAGQCITTLTVMQAPLDETERAK